MAKILQYFSFHSKRVQLSLCSLLIVLYYHIHTGISIFNPNCFTWLLNNEELAVLFFGWDFFHNEPWSFPIGQIQNYFYPLGTNIYMTDIPLMALAFKPLSFILPERFQYVGIWMLTNHILQAWFSILLCERFEIKGFRRLIVCLFLIFSPVFLIRFQHATLYTHWLILASFYVYFIDPQKIPVKKIILYQLALIVVSSLVMLYAWLIIFGFATILLLRLWLVDKKIRFQHAILLLFGQAGLVLFLWMIIGLISLGPLPNYQTSGWGEFSLNLNAFFNPINTSSLLPTLPYFPSQYVEGYAYLGAGVLVLIILSIALYYTASFLKLSRLSINFRESVSVPGINMVPLILFLVSSCVFALSCNITFNQNLLFHYELKGFFLKVANSFRASGRFSWPLYYFILFVLFKYLNKINISSLLVNSILAGCFLLQVYDLQSFFLPARSNCESYRPPISPSWETLISYFDKIVFYPGFARSYSTFDDYRYFTYYAGQYHKKINIGYVARFNATLAATAIKDLSNKIGKEGLNDSTLYISFDAYLNRLALPLNRDNVFCFNIDGYLAIFKKTKDTESVAKFLEQSGVSDKRAEIATRLVATRPFDEGVSSLVTKSVKMGFYETDDTEEHSYFKGWAFHEKSNDVPNDSLYLILESISQQRWIYPVPRFGTSDVVTFFNRPDLVRVGFGLSFLKKNLATGYYRVGLLFTNTKTSLKSLFWLEKVVKVDRTIDPDSIKGLPLNALGIKFSVNTLRDTLDSVKVECWAFPNVGNCEHCKAFFTLNSQSLTYAAEATRCPRPDVASFFKDSTLQNTGLEVSFTKALLPKGTYELGILFKDTIRRIDYYAATGKFIYAGLVEFVKPEPLKSLPLGKESIRAFIDKVEEKEAFFQVDGWAFIDNLSTDFSETELVLKSKDGSYSLAVIRVARADLQAFFKPSYRIEMGGLTVKFRKKDLRPGEYQLCVMVLNKKSNVKTLHSLENIVKIK